MNQQQKVINDIDQYIIDNDEVKLRDILFIASVSAPADSITALCRTLAECMQADLNEFLQRQLEKN